MRLAKIISGGQTGVDRGALDAAIAAGLSHGGYCPLGRLAEDGVIPARYRLTELQSRHYAARTAANVDVADATLTLTRGRSLSAGTRLTRRLAREGGKPLCVIDLSSDALAEIDRVACWIEEHAIRVLNIAGPRESQAAGIHDEARQFVGQLLAKLLAKSKEPRTRSCRGKRPRSRRSDR